jgi:hypothetical protein
LSRIQNRDAEIMVTTRSQSRGNTPARPTRNSKKEDNKEQQKNGGKSSTKENKKKQKQKGTTSPTVYITLVALAAITYVAMPDPLQPHHGEEPSIQHVFYYGWLTAISTGLGVVPLVFAPNLDSFWVGISNGKYPSPSWLI